MRFPYAAALCGAIAAMSHQAGAIPIPGCAALPSVVRLASYEDPGGWDQVNAINDSCVAVGVSSDESGSDMAIWTGTDLTTDPSSVQYTNPYFEDPACDDGSGGTEALDVNNQDEVLVKVGINDCPNAPQYAIFYMTTDTWSGPINPAVSWNHTPQLTNSSGWAIDYGTNWAGYESAYLVDTPEPGSLLLCSLGGSALLLLGYLRAPHRRRTPRA